MEPPSGNAPHPGAVGALRATLVTYLLLTLLTLVPFVVLLSPYLVSLATGAILAVLCHPLYSRLRGRLPDWAAGLVVTLGVVALVLVPVSALAVGAARQGSEAIGRLAAEGAPTIVGVVAIARDWVPFLDTLASPAELEVWLKGGLTTLSEVASRIALVQIQAFPVVLLQVILVVLSTYFALVDGAALYNWIGEKLPLSLQIRSMLAASFRTATNAVVLASVAAASAQAVVILAGFWVLGVPSALLAAGLTFVLGWVPGLPMLAWGAATLYLYSQGSLTRAVLMVGVGVIVGVIDNIVRPLVLRGQKAIHPMVSLVAILGGIAFFGVPGVFIGPLIACMAIAVLEIWPAVASYCGIAVSGSGDLVPNVPMRAAPGSNGVGEAPAADGG